MSKEDKCACGPECGCGEACDCGDKRPCEEVCGCCCNESGDCENAPVEADGKAAEYLEMAQRIQAEFENYKRRNKNAREEALAEGKTEAVGKLLSVLDNLERALEAADVGEGEGLKQGIEMVVKQFAEALAGMDITAFAGLGEKFDHTKQFAVGQELRPDTEPGTITQVLQKGYAMKDYVIRPAMVLVQGE